MIRDVEILIAESLVATGLVNAAYHSVEQVEDKAGKKFPAYKMGGEEYYVGPDDAKNLFSYSRLIGPVSKLEEQLEGSCSKKYRVVAPLRIVFFEDNNLQNFDALAQKLMSAFIFLKDISFQRLLTNADQVGKEESPKADFAIDAKTFYIAVDIQAKIWISPKDCPEDTCNVHPNPICKK